MAALAMVAIVGGLAMVVDTGMFLVVQRQLQSAADAAALAGAWHDPICPKQYALCDGVPLAAPPGPPGQSMTCDGSAQYTACDVAAANTATIGGLCYGAIKTSVAAGTTLIRPRAVNTIVVTVECDATYSFGRILGLGSKHISSSAAAVIGNRDATPPGCAGTEITNFEQMAPCGRVARLIE
jgi:uncharacterized membrane protein